MAKNLKQGHNVLKNMVEVLDKGFLFLFNLCAIFMNLRFYFSKGHRWLVHPRSFNFIFFFGIMIFDGEHFAINLEYFGVGVFFYNRSELMFII